MIQQGTIREISKDRIVVGCGQNGGCKSCSSAFCSGEDQSVFEVSNPKALELSRGDRVELYLAPGKTIFAGFMVLVVPLLLFAILYMIAAALSDSEVIPAISGLAGLAGGFGLSFLFSRIRKEAKLPEITAVLPAIFSPERSG